MIWQQINDRAESTDFSGFEGRPDVPALVAVALAFEAFANTLNACARRFLEGD